MHLYTSVFRTHLGHVFTTEFAFHSELGHKHILLNATNITCNEIRMCLGKVTVLLSGGRGKYFT